MASQVSDIQARIDVMLMYQDSTYTYLKECPTIVVGFDATGPQFLKLPCRYGGIRDIGSYVYGNPTNVDLGGYLLVRHVLYLSSYIKSVTEQTLDIKQSARGWARTSSDLTKLIYGLDVSNIPSYIKQVYGQTLDLGNNTARGWATRSLNLTSTIRQWKLETEVLLPAYLKPSDEQFLDLSSYLKDNIAQYLDIRTILKGWKYKVPVDLGTTIRQWSRENEIFLTSYLKDNVEQYLDLPSYLKDNIEQYLNLGTTLHSWQEAVLYGIISTFESFDLGGQILSTIEVNLSAYLNTIPGEDISSSIHGWQETTLSQRLTAVFGPYDLQAYIYAITHKNLSSYIKSVKGSKVPFDLQGILESYHETDLRGIIYMIDSVNLSSYLNPSGGTKDLPSFIYPKTISIKSYLTIALLDHSDLLGFINQGCFGSGHKNLTASLVAKYAYDLSGSVFPVREGTVANLNSTINIATYLAQNTINITLVKNRHKVVNIPVKFYIKSAVYNHDTLDIVLGKSSFRNLQSLITGLHFTSDLASTLTPTKDISYTLDPYELPSHTNNPNQIVLTLTGGRESWRREVELMFRTSAEEYYYLERAGRAVRYSGNNPWSLVVTGFDRIIDGSIDRSKLRKHYLTDLRNHDTVDAAIRDLIDRVTLYKQTDLAGSIQATGGYRNLGGYLNNRAPRSSYKHLTSIARSYAGATKDLTTHLTPTRFITGLYSDLTQEVSPWYLLSGSDLTGLVAHYPFSDGSLLDATDNHYDLVPAGGTLVLAPDQRGDLNQAYGLEMGTADSLTATFSFLPTEFSVMFIIKPESNTNYNNLIAADISWGPFMSHGSASGGVYCGTHANNRFDPSHLPGIYVIGEWCMIVYTFDGGFGRFYKDGILISGPRGQTPSETWPGFSFRTIDGVLSYGAVWERTLSQTEITNIFNRSDI